jgi:hypothetical protein
MLPMLVRVLRELTEPTPNEPDGDGETDEIVQFHDVSVAHNGTFVGSEKSSLRTFLDTTVGWLHRAESEGELPPVCERVLRWALQNALALVVVTKLYWVSFSA